MRSEAKKIARREFVRTASAAAAALPAATAAACRAEPREGAGGAPAVQTRRRVVWRLASSFPRGLDTLYGGAETLAQRLAAISEGYFTVRPYPAGELVPGLQVMDAVEQGTVSVGHTASYYFTGKSPALAFDAGIPFGLTTRQQFAWLYHGGGLELLNAHFADFNIVIFPAGSTGAQMGGWFKREVNSLADLRGLRMRIPGLGGEVMSRLGVTVQVLAGGDIYPALERGVIDATEWVGPYDDEKLGFYRVAKNYYYPGWWEPGPTLSFHVNLREWNALPKEYREWFRSAAVEASSEMLAKYDAVNPPALERLLARGVQLRPFPEEILTAARRAAFDLYEEHAAKDATYRKIYEAWKRFRAQSYRWFSTAELAYAAFAYPRG
jgi:TRAP-type mannitol/chloroaromatic compound transport system substrate-binding protein